MSSDTLIDANWLDYLLVAIYFGFVLGIGVMARRSVSDSIDFFLSGRSLPAWVTGLAFISANLGAIELLGMAANGAQYGLPTLHYYWIGAIPAMVFLGLVMMPFYYGAKGRIGQSESEGMALCLRAVGAVWLIASITTGLAMEMASI